MRRWILVGVLPEPKGSVGRELETDGRRPCNAGKSRAVGVKRAFIVGIIDDGLVVARRPAVVAGRAVSLPVESEVMEVTLDLKEGLMSDPRCPDSSFEEATCAQRFSKALSIAPATSSRKSCDV